MYDFAIKVHLIILQEILIKGTQEVMQIEHDDVLLFLGSIYELSGSEVCLSTGDLVKIIGLELLSVSCEEIDTGASFELPTGYLGEPLNNNKVFPNKIL